MKAFVLDRDVLRASGPDATEFLQGQLSQDVANLGERDSAWSFLLQPQGKVEALVRVTRMAGDEWLLDVDGGYGEPVKARLERFKLRVKCEIEPLDWGCVALRDWPGGGLFGLGVAARWPAHDGIDLLGPGVEPPEDADIGTVEEYERLRIEAGWPAMGAELTDGTIPNETGLVDLAVSFTKGCYTGQELVARIDSRGGNVARHLRGVVLDGPGPSSGASIEVDGKVVGTLTSVAGDVALGYVGRAVEPPAETVVVGEDGSVAAQIRPLPLV
jgi:tRNA-modifying protein YgfZ